MGHGVTALKGRSYDSACPEWGPDRPTVWGLDLGRQTLHASASSPPHHRRHIEHRALRDLGDGKIQRTKGPRVWGKLYIQWHQCLMASSPAHGFSYAPHSRGEERKTQFTAPSVPQRGFRSDPQHLPPRPAPRTVVATGLSPTNTLSTQPAKCPKYQS